MKIIPVQWCVALVAVTLWVCPVVAPAMAQDAVLNDTDASAVGQVIGRYWNVADACNLDAPVRLKVGVTLDRDGIPIGDSMLVLEATGPSEAVIARVYAAARRAILRAGATGLPVSPQNYAEWKNLELTFGCGELLVG